MWLRLSILFLLAGCGFQPMAAQRGDTHTALPRVTINAQSLPELTLTAQNFRNHLDDLLSAPAATPPSYRLDVSLATEVSGGLIAPDGKAQRYNITLNSNYTLTRLADNQLVDSGRVYRMGSYNNRPNVYFSTFVSEQDTIKRLSTELAEEYRLLLASRLGSAEKLGKPAPKIEKKGIFEGL